MGNQIPRNYLLHFVPALSIPTILYIFDKSISLTNLLKVGLMFPLLLLAVKGLQFYFPPKNVKDRSMGRIIECSLLNGMIYAAFMVLFAELTRPWLQPTLATTVGVFLIGSAAMTLSTIMVTTNQQKTLRVLHHADSKP